MRGVKAAAEPFFAVDEAEGKVKRLKKDEEKLKEAHESDLKKHYGTCEIIFKKGKLDGMIQYLEYRIIDKAPLIENPQQEQKKQ